MKPTTKPAATIVTVSLLLILAGCGDDHPTGTHVDPTVAPVPSGVFTITGDGQVEVYWAPVREAGVLGYGVYRSLDPDGAYNRIADVAGENSDFYLDSGLENGVTYFYAVDSYTESASSSLSYEEVADTPRPERSGVALYHRDADPDRSAIDFTVVQDGVSDDVVLPWDHPDAEYYLVVVDGLFRLIPAEHVFEGETFYNDIQDFGYTDRFDEIGFAPAEGWALDPLGVEIIEGHTYILWTWDDHFAKIRVVAAGEANRIVIDWAYQTSEDEIERFQLKKITRPRRKWNPRRSAG